MTRRFLLVPAVLAVVALGGLGLAGCSDDTADAPRASGPEVTTPRQPVTGPLVVLAETDLAPAIEAVAPEFEQANPGASVDVESLAADEIVARVTSGDGDVVALADAAAMDDLEGTGLVASVVLLPDPQSARAGAVVSSTNPSAATRFVELAAR